MTAGALTNGYSTSTQLNCSSGFPVGNRVFKNYESGAYGYIGFAKALEVSCNTFFYRVGYDFWQRLGSDEDDVNARDPLVEEAQTFGFGSRTGIDLPGEASGRIADRKWKLAYYKSMKDYYCGIADKPQDAQDQRLRLQVRLRVLPRGLRLPRRRRGQLRDRPGRHDRHPAPAGPGVRRPLQRRHALRAPRRQGDRLPAGDRAAADRAEGERARPACPKRIIDYIDEALKGVTRVGTMSWRMIGFPLDQVKIRSKTGSAEVYGKQSTSWVASYTEDYVVVMMVSQGGTGSGTSGPAIRKIWEALYGIRGARRRPGPGRDPRHLPARRAADVREGRLDPAAGPEERLMAALRHLRHARPAGRPARARARLAADGGRPRAAGARQPAGLVGDVGARATSPAATPRRTCASSWSTSRSAWC